MFHRRAQRFFRGLGTPDVPPQLRRANQLMAVGDYENAALAFKDLAQRAEERFPHRSPILFMEAGRAAILSGQTVIGVANLRRGLTILAAQGRIARMQALGQRAIEELKERGLIAEAKEVSNLVNGVLLKELPREETVNSKKPILPTHCPACGAALRSNEVDWLDNATAECDYCGSPVRGE